MIVALTVGHAGRPSRWSDRGACFEGVEEVSVVRRYSDAADRALRARGHQVVLLSDGEYPAQWARADALPAGVYVNAHVNAGGGDYGLVLYDHRSSRGAALAAAVSDALGGLPWRTRVSPCRPDTNGTARDADFSEAFGCIRGVAAPALCFEPYFLDGPQRAAFLGDLDAVGTALAAGIDAWSRR